jgi:hypothetical protein
MIDSMFTKILTDAAMLEKQKKTTMKALRRSIAECMLKALIERTKKQNIVAESSCTLNEMRKMSKQADTEKKRDQNYVDFNHSEGKAHTDDSDAY